MTDNYSDIQDLISLELAGQTSASEKKYLHELIQDDEAVRKIWEERSAHHKAMASAYQSVDRDAAWAAIDARTVSRRRPIYRWISVAAASVAIAVGIYTFYPSNKPVSSFDHSAAHLTLADGKVIDLSSPQKTISIPNGPTVSNNNRSLSYDASAASGGINTLWAPAGSDYRIVLSDGTEVFLNSMTKLSFPFKFTGSQREITIDGEAYLKVAADASRPFIVHMPAGDVTVLGTEFNVNTYEQPTVALVSGSVRVQVKDKTTLVKPGQQVVYKDGFQTASFDSKEVLSWMEGLHMFNNASLAEIVKVLPRWYGVEVVLDNASTAQSRFTGYVDRNRPISEFLSQMKLTSDADFYYEGPVLHFR